MLQHITDFASQIPMNLWLTALPQLISRLCHTNKDVSEITKGIIAKILNTYPQQVRSQLIIIIISGFQTFKFPLMDEGAPHASGYMLGLIGGLVRSFNQSTWAVFK